MYPLRTITLVVALALFAMGLVAAQTAGKPAAKTESQALVTFVELGSVKCIPCRMMQPVMKSIEAKYGSQIRVVFYDIWKPENRKYAEDYGVRVIPTQVFLDVAGKEIFRHEGFFPESEIDALLARHGLKIAS